MADTDREDDEELKVEGADADPIDDETEGDEKPPKKEEPPKENISDELKTMREVFGGAMQRQGQVLDALAADRISKGQPADDAPQLTVSDDEIEKALEAGDTKLAARLTRKMAKEEAAVSAYRLRKDHIETVAGEVRGYGLPAISRLVSRMAALDPKLKGYDKVRSEVEAEVAKLSPAAQLTPETYEATYRYIMGDPARREQEINDAIEADRRSRVPNPGNAGTGRVGRFAGAEKGVPSPEDLGFDRGIIEKINARGGPDQWAKRHGFRDWSDYTKEYGGNA